MSEVKQRVEALRKAKEDELYAAECKKKDELIQWEAEMILALEEYTDERIMNEFTDDMNKFDYLYMLLPKLGYKLSSCIEVCQLSKARDVFGRHSNKMVQINRCSTILPIHIQKYLITDHHHEKAFKARFVFGHLNYIFEKSEYIEKERARKEKKPSEIGIANEKADEEK